MPTTPSRSAALHREAQPILHVGWCPQARRDSRRSGSTGEFPWRTALESSANTSRDSLVRVRLSCQSLDTFVDQFAANCTRGGIFLPSRKPRAVGTTIRFELVLPDGEVVLAGEGDVIGVKQFDPAEPRRAHGMAVKFRALSPSSEPVLERLLERRQATRSKQRESAAGAGVPSPTPEPTLPAALSEANVSPPVALALPPAAALPSPSAAAPPSAEIPVPPPPTAHSRSERSPQHDQRAPRESSTAASPPDGSAEYRQSPARMTRVLTGFAAAAATVVLAVTMVRGRVGDDRPAIGQSAAARPRSREALQREPVKGAAPAAVAVEAPVEPPAPPVAPVARPPVAEIASRLRVDDIRTGASYQRYSCPEPISRFSLAAHKRVNICLEFAPMHDPVTEDVTVVWERDGTVFSATPMTVAARHFKFHTRAHMALDERRVGEWSVRIVSKKGLELARTSFHVAP
jgi:hypothetical protein